MNNDKESIYIFHIPLMIFLFRITLIFNQGTEYLGSPMIFELIELIRSELNIVSSESAQGLFLSLPRELSMIILKLLSPEHLCTLFWYQYVFLSRILTIII